MSAPRTNIDTQKRRHRGPLIGMGAVVAFALALLFWQTADVVNEGTPEESGAGQIDGRTGARVADPPAAPPAPAPDLPEGDVPVTPEGDLPPQPLPTPNPAPDAPLRPPAAP